MFYHGFSESPKPPESDLELLKEAQRIYPAEKSLIDRYLSQGDVKRLRDAEEKFRFQSKDQWAEILESLIAKESDRSEWFGSDIRTFSTSKFDDVLNGNDMGLWWEDKETPNGITVIAIDVTTSTDFTVISDKLGKTLEVIDDPRKAGSEIKQAVLDCFDPQEIEEPPLPFRHLPRAVIGLSRGGLESILVQAKNKNWGKQALAESELQVIFLEQIGAQLSRELIIITDHLTSEKTAIATQFGNNPIRTREFQQFLNTCENLPQSKPDQPEEEHVREALTHLISASEALDAKFLYDKDKSGYLTLFLNTAKAYSMIQETLRARLEMLRKKCTNRSGEINLARNIDNLRKTTEYDDLVRRQRLYICEALKRKIKG